ncbi:MAG: cation:proton antiporter [Pseudomonadota bacterium]
MFETLNQNLEQMPSAHSLLVIGLLLGMTLVIKGLLVRSPLPPLLIYLLAGLALGWGGERWPLLDAESLNGLSLLAEAGLVLLLFKVGLESDLNGLLSQLPSAFWIWWWNIVVSGGTGFAAAYCLLDFDLLTSIFVAVALTATSLGVTVAMWQSALKSRRGQLLVDVAELDDLSSIALMAVAVALAPQLMAEGGVNGGEVLLTIGRVVAVLTAFALFCWLFSVFLEHPITRFVERRKTDQEPMVLILAIVFVMSALAELSGLSLAVGAFMAGLAFSRDTEAAKERVVFQGLYDFFTPFFFIHLGLLVDISAFEMALWPGLVLLAAAVAGKLIGAGLPAWRRLGWQGGALVGLSMVPRAEIAMVVMQKGLAAGASSKALSAMVVVSVGSIVVVSLMLPWCLRRAGVVPSQQTESKE